MPASPVPMACNPTVAPATARKASDSMPPFAARLYENYSNKQ